MGFFRKALALFQHGYSDYAEIPPGGMLISFASGFMPHGGGIRATLRSVDGRSGTLAIERRPRFPSPPDLSCIMNLEGERFEEYARLLMAADLEPCNARVTDGWRTCIRGFTSGRAWIKVYVIGGERYQFARQVAGLQHIMDALVAEGVRFLKDSQQVASSQIRKE